MPLVPSAYSQPHKLPLIHMAEDGRLGEQLGGGEAQKVHGVKSALSSVCRASLQVSLAYLHNSFSKSYQTPHCTPATSFLGG